MYTNSEGIVLRQIKTTGGRRIVIIFTKRYGKISMGTGSNERNAKSKAALAIRPFTYGTYEFYKNREYYNLSTGEVKRSYYAIGEDIDKYMSASFVLELTEKFLPEDIPQPRIFNLLLDFLEALEKRKRRFETLILAYELKALGILGVAPVMDKCVLCGSEKVSRFSVIDGGMICEECFKKILEEDQNKNRLRLISKTEFDIVSIINFFNRKSFGSFEKIALEEQISDALQSIIRDYYSYHLDIGKLKSEGMLPQNL